MCAAIWKQAYEFSEKKPQLYLEIVDMFGTNVPPHIFVNIANHTRLFGVFKRHTSSKFITALDALDQMTRAGDDHVLIFLSELQLYGLYTVDEYVKFMYQLSEKIADELQSTPCQVVLADRKQKLVFICNADDKTILTKISKYVQDYLGSNIKTCEGSQKIEITVNKISDISRDDMFDGLFTYISQRDKSIADLLSLPKVIREREYKYTIPRIDISIKTTEELLSVLKTGHTININAPIIINNGGTMNNNIIGATVSLGHDAARDWIKNNPPFHEKTGDYYAKYKTKIKNPLRIQEFAKVVTGAGYTHARCGSFNIWKKSE